MPSLSLYQNIFTHHLNGEMAQRFSTPLSEGPIPPSSPPSLQRYCLAKNRETTPGGNERRSVHWAQKTPPCCTTSPKCPLQPGPIRHDSIHITLLYLAPSSRPGKSSPLSLRFASCCRPLFSCFNSQVTRFLDCCSFVYSTLNQTARLLLDSTHYIL